MHGGVQPTIDLANTGSTTFLVLELRDWLVMRVIHVSRLELLLLDPDLTLDEKNNLIFQKMMC